MKKNNALDTFSRMLKFVLPLLVILFVHVAARAQAPAGATFCANDFGTCTFDGEREVIYGANGVFVRKVIKGGSVCLPVTFGVPDPVPGVVKSCYVVDPKQVTKVVRDTGTTTTPAGSETIARTVTFKNNGGFTVYGSIERLDPSNKITGVGKSTKELLQGSSESLGGGVEIPLTDPAEVGIGINNSFFSAEDVTVFRAALPKNKALTTFCYDISGTYFVPVVKACGGGEIYESKYILFKNEAGYDANMTLTFYALGSSTPATTSMPNTSAGYQRKLYLPLNADTNRQMTLKVTKLSSLGNEVMLTKDVGLNAFDTAGSTCYKVWGSIISKKVSPCSANSSARTIKLKNNGAFQAKMVVTYDENGTATVIRGNPLEVLESDTVEVPSTTSKNPIKISFLAYNKEFNSTTVSANFTGELCYKLEGTAFAPTAATCDDTVGDTSGKTRQIRFQNDAGYDAQMVVSYFVDETINGMKLQMPKLLSTGMINGLGGKFRLVTIPKDTAKGMPITIAIQGNATVKNDIFSTTLPADFAASPQPCFKVWAHSLIRRAVSVISRLERVCITIFPD